MKKTFYTLLIGICFNLLAIQQAQQIEFLTTDNYQEKVSAGKIVVVEYWADWNAQNAHPINLLQNCTVYRVNVDKDPILVEQYNVHTIPTVLVYKDGEEKARLTSDITFKGRTSIQAIQDVVNFLNQAY